MTKDAKVTGSPPQADGTSAVDNTPDNAQDASITTATTTGMRSSKGWDGKLRLPVRKAVVLANPEALSDPEYSDDDNVVPGELIAPDENLLDDEDPDTDEIICTHARVHDLAALRLERFARCRRLCLRQNSIDTLRGCTGLTALAPTLQELDLYDNLIAHMRGVETLPHLTSLDLSFNKIRHIKHVEGLQELTELYLVANKIGTIEGLQTSGLAATLRMLELGSNRIRELRGLDGLTALEELWLAKNKITSLAGLTGLPRLRLLSVQSNRIRDLAPLAAVPTLEELYVSHNALTSLESLAAADGTTEDAINDATATATSTTTTSSSSSSSPTTSATILPLLRTLDIGNNQITSLRGIEGLTQLEELWAGYNQLVDFADIERTLGDKRALETVYFEGNPLQLRAPALYRHKVRLAVPQVQQIDATYVREL
ncbi:protein phosphatase pp1 regulatory subunit [Niveomyces insectorum RCEF 264]|uniref:Protein phosphatase pp1 regulatory subunit n=1 Tax=Niveomyces insectorum RCEF 264 TaxID=1081102 RepID=A0A167WFM9_9HYPO|nr:protein phosphatase pp1 regulatory subunit [Niveomyces insectorum RCEF 264]